MGQYPPPESGYQNYNTYPQSYGGHGYSTVNQGMPGGGGGGGGGGIQPLMALPIPNPLGNPSRSLAYQGANQTNPTNPLLNQMRFGGGGGMQQYGGNY
jgi:hypothetical protein